jgi:hypothetical protein
MTKLSNPIPVFLDTRGALMDGGHVYVGEANADPATHPIDLFWDAAMEIPATQPLRTIGGRIVNGATPSSVFFAEVDFSMRSTDVNGVLCDYSPSVFTSNSEFQPLDSDLTAIAALATTPFGRALLTLADQAALVAATGIAASLPLTGGTVTGAITRQGAGIHPYWSDPLMTGGRIFITAAGASDPTSQPGDLWFTY